MDKQYKNLVTHLDREDHDVKDLTLATLDDTLKLSTIVKDNEKYLVIGIGDLGCQACSQREIELIKSFDSGMIDKNVIIMAKFKTKRQHQLFIRSSQLNVYRRIDKKEPIFGYEGQSIMFVLNDNLIGTDILDIKKYPNLSYDYYKLFFHTLTNNHKLMYMPTQFIKF